MKHVTKDQEQAAFEDWLTDNCPSGDVDSVQRQWEASYEYEDLYAPQPPAQRKPLTDEEIWKFWWSRPEVPEGEDDSMEAEFVTAVRAVLAAHGIKENT